MQANRKTAILLCTVLSTAEQPVWAQRVLDQQTLARELLSADREERNGAFYQAYHIPPDKVGPELRKALIAFLERQNLVREKAAQAGIPVGTVEDPEFVASVHRTVARLNDPEAIPALARALGMFTVIRALVKFGDRAAPAVLGVVSSPTSRYTSQRWWYAIDLAVLFDDDAELLRLLEDLASDPKEIASRGVDDPDLAEKTRGRAAGALAAMRARRWP